jgi:hypothetical protein
LFSSCLTASLGSPFSEHSRDGVHVSTSDLAFLLFAFNSNHHSGHCFNAVLLGSRTKSVNINVDRDDLISVLSGQFTDLSLNGLARRAPFSRKFKEARLVSSFSNNFVEISVVSGVLHLCSFLKDIFN